MEAAYMTHIVLLGDSIFDNGRYVPGGPSVIEHLRRCLPSGSRAALLARDGAGTAEMARQLEQLPGDATHLVISVAGTTPWSTAASFSTSRHSHFARSCAGSRRFTTSSGETIERC
jgi:hypothetical protein